jgi:flagellar motor switch protein FliM
VPIPVSQTITADEMQALLERGGEPGRDAVAPRDFRRPCRLSPSALARLRRAAEKALPEVSAALAVALRRDVEAEVASVDEIDGHALVAGWTDPVCVLAFECARLPGWLVWEPAAGVIAAETALGSSEPASGASRALSAIERMIVTQLLARVATALGGALGVAIEKPVFCGARGEVGALDDLPRNADRRRVGLEIALSGPGEGSRMSIYLSGVAAGGDDAPPVKEKTPAALPAYASDIEVEVGARLGTIEAPLADLLALEPGDVLLLGVGRGGVLDLVVEGEPCARARFGEHDGRLAVRVESAIQAVERQGRGRER